MPWSRRARRVSTAGLAVLFTGMLVLAAFPAARGLLSEIVAWLRGSGAVGKAVAVGATLVGIPLGVPSIWFAALLGYLYGLALGLPLAIAAIMGGASIAFALGRWLLADEVADLLASRSRLGAVVQAVGDEGLRLVILLRLAGPHNLFNLVFAASTLRARDFLVGTLIGSLPSWTLAAAAGALAPDAGSLWHARDRLGWAGIPLLALGTAAFVAGCWLTVRATRRAMRRADLTSPSGTTRRTSIGSGPSLE